MQRSTFLVRSLAAIGGAAFVPLVPLRSAAQLATFDAAQYANAIDQIAKTTVITSQQVAQINEAIQIYNEVHQMNGMSLQTIWPILQQHDQKLLKLLDKSALLGKNGKTLYDVFKREFPTWKPGQAYDQLYDMLEEGIADNTRATLEATESIVSDAADRAKNLQQIVAQTPKSPTEAVEKTNQILNLTTHAVDDVRGLLGVMIRDQAGYYEYEMKNKALSNDKNAQLLLSAAFGRASQKL